MRRCLTFVALLGVTGLSLSLSQAQNSHPDPALRATLESSYHAWRESVVTQNHQQWEASTAYSRQIEIRNRIVSQKLPFPEAFFADPLKPPSLDGMIALGVLSTGQTATSTYYGKANFGAEPGTTISDNLMVLHFLLEEGAWKFDRLRLVKTGNDAELLLQIRNSDFSFLNGIEFQPAQQLPPLPQPVNTPDLLAEIWVDSTGYEITVTVNGIPNGTFSNIKTAELLIGGLRNGENRIQLQIKPLEAIVEGSPRVEVAIYAASGAEEQADRVFHYQPEIPEASVDSVFVPR
ncbi:MAG: hypothetical protein AAGA96_08230 [Verrucomicrobiota bacterium]